MKVEIVKLTPSQIAEAFCELNDEEQADFFIETARRFEEWGPAGRSIQAHSIGRHLKTCSCSTYEARALVSEIAGGLE